MPRCAHVGKPSDDFSGESRATCRRRTSNRSASRSTAVHLIQFGSDPRACQRRRLGRRLIQVPRQSRCLATKVRGSRLIGLIFVFAARRKPSQLSSRGLSAWTSSGEKFLFDRHCQIGTLQCLTLESYNSCEQGASNESMGRCSRFELPRFMTLQSQSNESRVDCAAASAVFSKDDPGCEACQ